MRSMKHIRSASCSVAVVLLLAGALLFATGPASLAQQTGTPSPQDATDCPFDPEGFWHNLQRYLPNFTMDGSPSYSVSVLNGAAIDLDRDGVVTADEAAAHFETMFDLYDADGDQKITESEYLTMPGRGPGASPRDQWLVRRTQRFERIDTDGDRALTFLEFMNEGKAAFTQADSDGNGTVSVWEFRAARRGV